MRLRRLLRGCLRGWDEVAEIVFGIVSGVVICRPGGSYPRCLLVTN